jgi:hypothetical protein
VSSDSETRISQSKPPLGMAAKLLVVLTAIGVAAAGYGFWVYREVESLKRDPNSELIAMEMITEKKSYLGNLHAAIVVATAYYVGTGVPPPKTIVRKGYDKTQFASFKSNRNIYRNTYRTCYEVGVPPFSTLSFSKGKPPEGSGLELNPPVNWAAAPGTPP